MVLNVFSTYFYKMKSEVLYEMIESASKEQKFNLNGVWNKISYTAKMLMCDQMVASGTWMKLPEAVICFEEA